MDRWTRHAGALALALILCAPAATQTAVGKVIVAPAGYVPALGIYCDDGTGHAVICALGALPTGAATSAKQDALLAAVGTPLQAGGSVAVSNLPATQPVSAAALPLPAGAATATLQSSMITLLGAPAQAAASVVATSTPLTGTATSTAVTPTSGSASIASGVSAIGPIVPQLGLPIRLVLKGGASFSAYVGTTTGTDCSSVNQLTAGGQPIGYSGSVDEYVDIPPTTGGVKYCLILTVTSGTETYGVRQ